jgi:hypothetical protein
MYAPVHGQASESEEQAMKVKELALQAAAMRAWPSRQDPDGDLRVEIPTTGGRTQVVAVSSGEDGDGDAAGFIWSKAADAGAARDPWALLRLNAQLTYGKVALRGNDILVVHGIHDGSASLAEVGKALFWAARAADELEATLTGGDAL